MIDRPRNPVEGAEEGEVVLPLEKNEVEGDAFEEGSASDAWRNAIGCVDEVP